MTLGHQCLFRRAIRFPILSILQLVVVGLRPFWSVTVLAECYCSPLLSCDRGSPVECLHDNRKADTLMVVGISTLLFGIAAVTVGTTADTRGLADAGIAVCGWGAFFTGLGLGVACTIHSVEWREYRTRLDRLDLETRVRLRQETMTMGAWPGPDVPAVAQPAGAQSPWQQAYPLYPTRSPVSLEPQSGRAAYAPSHPGSSRGAEGPVVAQAQAAAAATGADDEYNYIDVAEDKLRSQPAASTTTRNVPAAAAAPLFGSRAEPVVTRQLPKSSFRHENYQTASTISSNSSSSETASIASHLEMIPA
ncbi:uncharacterized protein LOC135824859 isoform X2 [Sycon ciliatum]|uniref:uncharacterized protein LOC135824859 isoform X2 n=1 Tax=Sycon ciliatum TaxID=27933 RepID=UPI0031F62C3B|eukprot:scpid75299/ scgid1369/ 